MAASRVRRQHAGMDALADLSRRLANLIRLGTIAEVDYAAKRCTVKTGDLLTAPLPWIAMRAGDAVTAWAPSIGEQVVLLSPSGDPSAAVALPAIYSDSFPCPEGGDTAKVTLYPDGACITYDPATHQLDALLPEGGKANVTAPGGLHITGDTTITGKLHATDTATFDASVTVGDKLTAQTDVVGGGISLKSHKTTGVQPGSGLSGGPQ